MTELTVLRFRSSPDSDDAACICSLCREGFAEEVQQMPIKPLNTLAPFISLPGTRAKGSFRDSEHIG